jgi:hypothetical protein
MSEVIPFNKPPSKPKEDETAEFLKATASRQVIIKTEIKKAPRDAGLLFNLAFPF